jgi:hypothetical protein
MQPPSSTRPRSRRELCQCRYKRTVEYAASSRPVPRTPPAFRVGGGGRSNRPQSLSGSACHLIFQSQPDASRFKTYFLLVQERPCPPQHRGDNRDRDEDGTDRESPLGDATGQDDRSADDHCAASGEQPEYDQAHLIKFANCERQAYMRGIEIEACEQAEEREKQKWPEATMLGSPCRGRAWIGHGKLMRRAIPTSRT